MVALALVLYQLSLILVGLVVGFFKESLQQGKLCTHRLEHSAALVRLLTAGR